jgi:F-type H+-transporting ATPase subunit a
MILLSVRRGRRGALWFSLPIILWDNGIHYFHLLDLIMEKQWQNLMVISVINHHDGKIYDRCIWNLNRADGYPTNGRPIDFSITKTVLSNTSLLMILLFAV